MPQKYECLPKGRHRKNIPKLFLKEILQLPRPNGGMAIIQDSTFFLPDFLCKVNWTHVFRKTDHNL